MSVILEVARQTYLLQLRSKMFVGLLGLSLLGTLAMLAIPAASVAGNSVFQMATYIGGFMIVIPFVSLYFSVQAVSGDLEDRTSVFLFTRPVSRLSLIVGKWLGSIALAATYSVFVIGAMFLVLRFHPGDWWKGRNPQFGNCLVLWGACLIAAFGYSSFGCLFAAYFRRPMFVSILFVIVERIASRMSIHAGIHNATIAFPVRRFLLEQMDAVRGLSRFLRGRQMRELTPEQEELLLGSPLLAVAKTAFVVILLAAWIYSRREYESRPRE